MDQNLISINILAYNAQSTLKKTLESVLIQKNVLIEIIFVNDCSTDSTLSIMEEFKSEHTDIVCTIISNPINLGITKSRNIALDHSNGNFIAVLDSDDVWIDSNKLKKQIDFLIQNPEYVVVGTQAQIVNSQGSILKTTQYKTTCKTIKNKMLILNQFCHSSILMRKSEQKYDESLFIWEDYDLLLNLGIKHKFANLNEAMVDYLYVPKKYNFTKKFKLTTTEIQIIKRYKKYYPNFWIGYCKGLLKYILFLLHLK